CVLSDNAAASSARDSRGIIDRLGVLIRAAERDAASQSSIHSNRSRMQNRIGCGSLPVERLHIRDTQSGRSAVGSFDDIQAGTLGSGVIEIHLHAKLPNIFLEIEVPLLRIT